MGDKELMAYLLDFVVEHDLIPTRALGRASKMLERTGSKAIRLAWMIREWLIMNDPQTSVEGQAAARVWLDSLQDSSAE